MASPTLEEFYQKLEATSSYGYGVGDTPELRSLPPEIFREVCVEVNAGSKLSSEHLKEVFDKDRAVVISYLQHRLEVTNNIYLKARYHHFLAVFNDDKRQMQKAFDCYFDVLKGCVSTTGNVYADDFEYLTVKCLETGKKFKDKLEALLTYLESVLKEPSKPDRAKIEIITQLRDSNVKITAYRCLPFLIYQLAYRATIEGWKERALSLSRHFIVKFPDQSLLRTRIWTLAGDHEMNKAEALGNDYNNIVIAHLKGSYYEKAIAFYKAVSATEKMKAALRALEDNKQNLRFLSFGGSLPAETIERLQFMIHSTTSYLLSLPVRVLFDRLFHGYIHEWINEVPQASSDNPSTFEQFFTNRQADVNLNFKNKGAGHLGNSVQAKFKDDLIIDIYSDVLTRIIQEGNIRFEHLLRYLIHHTCFMHRRNKAQGAGIVYNWYSLIHEGLCSFLIAYSNMIKRKSFSYMLCIDSLIPKFEGILRNIVHLNGGQITKSDRDGNIVNKLLDELLADESLSLSFNEADIALFKYTFTSQGMNIRNDTAHGFYIPQDYSSKKALMVLSCVFRLTKFRSSEEHISEEEPANK